MKNNNIKKYSSESAGSKMVSNVPVCTSQSTLSEVKEIIFKEASRLDTLNYIYVVDDKKLVGVFSIQEIFGRQNDVKVKSFMETAVISARPEDDQEKVAILAIKHKLKVMPITKKNREFLGIVPSDVILDILHREHIEDLLHSIGLHKIEDFSAKINQSSPRVLAKMRLPWLIIGLFGGMLAAKITTFFEEPLKEHFILAAFIPLIVYMADAVGSQTQTLYVRSMAINHISQKGYFFKEIKVGSLMAIVLSLILFVMASFISSGNILIGTILGISLFLTIIFAMVVSVSIVWFLSKLGMDPALGSGPFGTIIADISSLLIYFLVAISLLNWIA